ncbi:MAG: protein TolR [Proteobacteria bacterium]|nr:protein TolR [Pseudomonadota bacterium]
MSSKRLMSAINVTPFVDVMLVLLIIFMVAAPMMTEGIDVALPEVEATGLNVPEEPLIVAVDATGAYFINNNKIKITELKKKLRAIFKTRKDKVVLLKADKQVAYGSVAKAMGEIRAAGITNIAMMTEPVKGK